MARELMTIRLDQVTRRRLASAARRRGQTPSEVARAALEAWLATEEKAAADRPFETIADLVGYVRGGDPDRSTGGGARSIRPGRGPGSVRAGRRARSAEVGPRARRRRR